MLSASRNHKKRKEKETQKACHSFSLLPPLPRCDHATHIPVFNAAERILFFILSSGHIRKKKEKGKVLPRFLATNPSSGVVLEWPNLIHSRTALIVCSTNFAPITGASPQACSWADIYTSRFGSPTLRSSLNTGGPQESITAPPSLGACVCADLRLNNGFYRGNG